MEKITVLHNLSMDECFFTKTILITRMEDNLTSQAKIIYCREPSCSYRGSYIPIENETDEEKVKRIMDGPCQDDYPSDELDQQIQGAFEELFPGTVVISDFKMFKEQVDAMRVTSSHFKKVEYLIAFAPEVKSVGVDNHLDELKNTNSLPNVKVEAFVIADQLHIFSTQHIVKYIPVEDWNRLSDKLKTLKSSLFGVMEDNKKITP